MAGACIGYNCCTYIYEPIRDGFPKQQLYKNRIIYLCACNNQLQRTHTVTERRGQHDDIIRQVYQQNDCETGRSEWMHSNVRESSWCCL
jgi:hypothetical protein